MWDSPEPILSFPRQLLVQGDSLMLEQPVSVASSGSCSGKRVSADMLSSEEEKLLLSSSLLNKIPIRISLE